MDIPSLLLSFTQWAEATIGAYGYVGIFLVSLIGNLTIVFPFPAFVFIFAMGSVLNPWLVGLAGALGGALGETTGYLLGAGSREVVIDKYGKKLKKAKSWTEKHGIFPVIIFFALTPLPSDIIGIFAGLIRYDFKKFLLANFIGKLGLNILIAFAGYYSFEAIYFFFAG